MLRYKKYGRLILFTTINKISGVCSIYERASVLEIKNSLENHRPIFSQILGYDDKSLDDETVGYYR